VVRRLEDHVGVEALSAMRAFRSAHALEGEARAATDDGERGGASPAAARLLLQRATACRARAKRIERVAVWSRALHAFILTWPKRGREGRDAWSTFGGRRLIVSHARRAARTRCSGSCRRAHGRLLLEEQEPAAVAGSDGSDARSGLQRN